MDDYLRARPSARLGRLPIALLLVLLILGLTAWPHRAAASHEAWQAPTPDPRGPAVAQLTASSLNLQAPPETILSVDLPESRARYPGCLRSPEAPEVNYKTDQLGLTDIAIISTCGWQPDEVITVTLMEPSGKLLHSEVKAVPSKHLKNVYQADLFFQPGVDAPQGKYRFTLRGSQSHADADPLKVNLFFNQPGGPRLYALPADRFQPLHGTQGGQHRLRLNGFLASEPVRLLVYRFEGTRIQFYGWQDLTTDSAGRLIITTDLPEIDPEQELHFFAYGRETHFVQMERFTPEGLRKTRRYDLDLYCPGALAPRLNAPAGPRGLDIQPVAGLALLDIQQQPGYGSRLLAQLTPSDPLRVYGYPKCIDRAFWWPVLLSKPARFGWVAESFLGQYRVEPVEAAAPAN